MQFSPVSSHTLSLTFVFPLGSSDLPSLSSTIINSRAYFSTELTLILLKCRIGWAHIKASKWQMGFNSAFKGLNVPQAHLVRDMMIMWTVLGLNSATVKRVSLLQNTNWLWGPRSLHFHGYRVFFSAVKRPGCEANHWPPSSVDVKNGRSYTISSPIMSSWCGQGKLY